MVRANVIGALGTVSKGVEKRLGKQVIRRRIKTIPTITILRSAKIFRKDLET